MRELKFRYSCVKPLSIFHQDFTLEEIEKGDARRWQQLNATGVGKEYRRQFTGLKDKNGKEIYEGDIVKSYSNHRKEWDIRAVVWENLGFHLSPRLGKVLGSDVDNFEIIGNIYENPIPKD